MMIRCLLLIAALLVLGDLATAQQDLGPRLRNTTGQPRHLRYDMRTGTIRPAKGPHSYFGPRKLYNNTCAQPLWFSLSPGDQVIDSGGVPSESNAFRGTQAGCSTAYNVNGFQIAYCSNQPSNDIAITFHSLYESCTDITISPVTAGFLLPGMPGSNSGGAACYVMDIDLMGTSFEFTFAGDGDGVWDDDSDLDTFGWTFEVTNLVGTSVGPTVAGDDVVFLTGCDWAVGTIFSQGDPTGSSPDGTGWGTSDQFAIQASGLFAGCFDFGGKAADVECLRKKPSVPDRAPQIERLVDELLDPRAQLFGQAREQ